jgi:hypothetical protein
MLAFNSGVVEAGVACGITASLRLHFGESIRLSERVMGTRHTTLGCCIALIMLIFPTDIDLGSAFLSKNAPAMHH